MTKTDPLLIAGRYRLLTTLAVGGMGVVWKGWDERLQRPVAVKQLRVQPGLSPAEAATARDRMMREARNTARLHHPNAVPVYDVVEQDGQPCLIMEFLPSISLQESVRQHGTMPPAEVARIGSEIATALSAAHQAGIVHRDVKPGNVLLAEDGTTKLTDFGISHALDDVTLTATGMLTGTPAYLAPEVARGQPSSFASDVFSLGSTLYTATEGSPPFGQDDNAMAVLHRVASGQLRPPQRSGALTPLLLRMLTNDPRMRPSMTEVSQTLAALDAGAETVQIANVNSAGPPTTRLEVPHTAPTPETLVDARPGGGPARVEPRRRGRLIALDARPGGGPARVAPPRRGRLIAAWVAGALVVTAVVTAIALANRDGNRRSPAQAGGPQSRSVASSTGSPSPSPTAPVAAQLARAITDYYRLVPNDLGQGWTRLTPSYQHGHAGGFAGYTQFWGQVRRVTVASASGQLPNTALATVTYVYKDGQVVVEKASYGLAMRGGVWKIDTSTVLSSHGG